jgi:hypothetical protein
MLITTNPPGSGISSFNVNSLHPFGRPLKMSVKLYAPLWKILVH